VDDQEFYQPLDRDGITDDIHLFNTKLREWEDYYNYHRPHGALDGQTPYERLLAKTKAGAVPMTAIVYVSAAKLAGAINTIGKAKNTALATLARRLKNDIYKSPESSCVKANRS